MTYSIIIWSRSVNGTPFLNFDGRGFENSVTYITEKILRNKLNILTLLWAYIYIYMYNAVILDMYVYQDVNSYETATHEIFA